EAVVAFTAPMDDPVFGFSISTDRGVMVYGEGVQAGRAFAAGDRVEFRVRIPTELVSGSYKAGLGVSEHDTFEMVASARPVHFYVDGRPNTKGVADLHGQFDFRSS
ncbi:MAG TPA: Wzt carbohydrate-binding domain-containing protein, partial [Acidimicrobiales bacterium]|nr:Wzt carbohydrate-binding domain-containing protein [Acidimicrobiales bacterium]